MGGTTKYENPGENTDLHVHVHAEVVLEELQQDNLHTCTCISDWQVGEDYSPISTAVPSTCIMELHLHIEEMKKISTTS